MIKYGEVWKSVVAYIWRTQGLEPVEEAGKDEEDGEDGEVQETEIRDKRPAYEFTAQQTKAFEQIRVAAFAMTAEDTDYEGSMADSEASGEASSEAGGETGGETENRMASANVSPGQRSAHKDDIDELEARVLDFFIALLDHDIGDNEYQNALYSGLAVLGIQAEHGWHSALAYTPVLSAIVTVARMFVLSKAKRARARQRRGGGRGAISTRCGTWCGGL